MSNLFGSELGRSELAKRLGRLDQLGGIRLATATNRDSGRWDARARGELRTIPPGEVGSYELDLETVFGVEAISALVSEAGSSHSSTAMVPAVQGGASRTSGPVTWPAA